MSAQRSFTDGNEREDEAPGFMRRKEKRRRRNGGRRRRRRV